MVVHEPPPRPAFRVVGGKKDRNLEETGADAPLGGGFLWRTFVLGAVLAQAFALPVLSFMGWFLASLVHEMGHAATAWLCGMPAFPAIRLDGHAAAVHREQSAGLVFVVAGGLAALAWHSFRVREHLPAALSCAALALLGPLLAFAGPLRELAFLVMGHGGELIFAGLSFVRAAEVGERSAAERVLYATVAWFLLWRNLTLFFGLLTRAEALIEYYGSGSFGLTNDLIRVAEDVLDCSVPSVAGGMLVVTLLVVPAAAAVGVWLRRAARA